MTLSYLAQIREVGSRGDIVDSITSIYNTNDIDGVNEFLSRKYNLDVTGLYDSIAKYRNDNFDGLVDIFVSYYKVVSGTTISDEEEKRIRKWIGEGLSFRNEGEAGYICAIQFSCLMGLANLQKEFNDIINSNVSDEEYIKLCTRFHYDFVRVHPLRDKNGTTSRMLMGILLIKRGLEPKPMYESYIHRKEYFDALDAANNGDFKPLEDYVCKSYGVGLFNR